MAATRKLLFSRLSIWQNSRLAGEVLRDRRRCPEVAFNASHPPDARAASPAVRTLSGAPTSELRASRCHEQIGDPTLADAFSTGWFNSMRKSRTKRSAWTILSNNFWIGGDPRSTRLDIQLGVRLLQRR